MGGLHLQHWPRFGSMNLWKTQNSKIQTPNKHQALNTKDRINALVDCQDKNKTSTAPLDLWCLELGAWSLVFGSFPWDLRFMEGGSSCGLVPVTVSTPGRGCWSGQY